MNDITNDNRISSVMHVGIDATILEKKDGMACHTHIYDDAYWIRVFAGQIIANAPSYDLEQAVNIAYKTLEEIKRREAEKKAVE